MIMAIRCMGMCVNWRGGVWKGRNSPFEAANQWRKACLNSNAARHFCITFFTQVSTGRMESTSSMMEPSLPDPDNDPRSEDNDASLLDNSHDNSLHAPATTEQADTTSQQQDAPCIAERKRSQFSYDASELRRRHIHKGGSKETDQEDHTTMNGGGFYECNIWYVILIFFQARFLRVNHPITYHVTYHITYHIWTERCKLTDIL